MQKTRILFLIHTLQVGGAEKALVNLVNNLDPKRFDTTVMTVVDTGAFREKLSNKVHYKTIIKLPFKNKSNSTQKSGNLLSGTNRIKAAVAKLYQFGWRHANLQKVYKKFITEKYDLEVAFLEGISAKIIANSDNPNSKKIAWIHVDLLEERKSEKFFRSNDEEKHTYQKFNQIIAVSNTVKTQFEKKFQYDTEKVVVHYNLINAEEITKLSKENIKKECFTICTVGRLSVQKGFDRLLQVVKRLNQDNINFDLWIIGEGAEEKKLNKYITDNHLENVKLLGYKPNPYPYIKAADLYVCSSRAEGFSTVVSEAIILGIPTISTDCSGAKEILGDSEYGIVCKKNEDDLYSSIKEMISNTKKRQYYAKQATERAKYFNPRQSINRITKLLETK